jgi:hypothetical protein
VQVISSDEVQTLEDEHQSRRVRITNFCGVRGQAVPGPQIFLVDYPGEAGVAVRPHFHSVDQFQVFWRGDRVGRHEIRPRTVHYADAYTSYGPIVDAGDGVTYMTVRARPDSGPKYMPESRSQRPAGAGGRQLTAQVDVHALDQDGAAWLLGPFDDGLGVRLVSLPADEQIPPAQAVGDGTVHMLLEGILTGPGQIVSYGATTVVTTAPGESASELRAAAQGAVLLSLSFPEPRH